MAYVIIGCHSRGLIGIFDTRDQVVECENAYIGDFVYTVDNPALLQQVNEFQEKSKNPGRDIKNFLSQKGLSPVAMPSRACGH